MGREMEVAEFSEFVAASQGKMVRLAELLTGDRGRAEDLAQHGFAKAYAAWRRIRTGEPDAYVRRCIVNAHTDWWRRRSWREQPFAMIPEQPSLADATAVVADRELVMRALSRLTPRERVVLVLRFYLDMSELDIANKLKIAPGTVKSAASRGLAKLRCDAELQAERIS
ncbi:MAG TPA: SigE family RNA polymerase sigma factor [Streptosporangiaceae bacterium]|nr:SigE family RNA polymerase sigma factor [Streptosporangiaceae bacterium]